VEKGLFLVHLAETLVLILVQLSRYPESPHIVLEKLIHSFLFPTHLSLIPFLWISPCSFNSSFSR
jgi:hypothetical protein